jgi:hypothetical protein
MKKQHEMPSVKEQLFMNKFCARQARKRIANNEALEGDARNLFIFESNIYMLEKSLNS